MAELSSPITLGDLQLKNRVIMAPLTRTRVADDLIPTQMMADYYAQRASAGLIISEAIIVSQQAIGYANTPAMFSQAQIAGWKDVTDAVHAKDGLIMAQLWHVGRISHPYFQNGQKPVSASDVQPAGQLSLLRPKQDYVAPRPLSLDEIQTTIADFKQMAINAKAAGFDGVELHAANGYLVDQFLQSSTNLRDDQYGGSVENRVRFLLDVVDVLIEVWGAGRVGVHLAPRCDENDMGDANPRETFGYAMQELGKRKIAFFFTREYLAEDSISEHIKQSSNGVPYVANMGLSRQDAIDLLALGKADAVAFGKAYIANPDLYERLVQDAPLNEVQLDKMIGTDTAEGYIDYPTLAMAEA